MILDSGVDLSQAQQGIYYAPPVEPILELRERTGMDLDISTGQRKLSYGSEPPPHKDECFIGGLLREAFEPEICQMLEQAGLNLHELRLMMGEYTVEFRIRAEC